jgi:hypothetical protein
MVKEQKENVNTLQETLSSEEKELINVAIKIAIAKKRKDTVAVSLVTLAKNIQMLIPIADLKTIIEYLKTELPKSYRLITLHDKIGEDTLTIEVVLLYNTIDELIEKNKMINAPIKIIDTELDSVSDYKQSPF